MNEQPPSSRSDPGTFWDARYTDAGYVFGEKSNQWLAENAVLLSASIRKPAAW